MPSPSSPSQAASQFRSTRFRFKSSRKHDSFPSSSHPAKRHKSSCYQHHSHLPRRHGTRSSTPTTPPLSPDTAFRESLFDALADDEGAAYWESVYGQPIHTYPHPRQDASSSVQDDASHDESGNLILERMSDEEYASYVRARMWEKSHSYIIEERKKRKQARKEERWKNWEEERKRVSRKEEAAQLGNLMDESMARGRRRKERTEWRVLWESYERDWEKLKEYSGNLRNGNDEPTSPGEVGNMAKSQRDIATHIPWPVKSGQSRDIHKSAVEEFMWLGPAAATSWGNFKESDLMAILKIERVRWHPDKMMRFRGALELQEKTLKRITEVFQILDELWSRTKATIDLSKDGT